MTRTLSVVAGVGALAVLAYLGMAWSIQRRVMFPSPAPAGFDPAAGIAGLQKIQLGADPAVEAWFLPPTGSGAHHPAVIFAHGNGELIDYWGAEFQTVRDWGVAVLLVEYPGYGRSPGAPTQSTITSAFIAAHDYLSSRSDIRKTAIVGYGRSLGGGAICQLAAKRSLAAVVLESTFSSVAALARPMGVPRWLVRDPFDNLAALRDYTGPVLLLHGERDSVIPFEHSELLHREIHQSVLQPMKCGHNDCPRPWKRIHRFLQSVGILPSAE